MVPIITGSKEMGKRGAVVVADAINGIPTGRNG